MFLVRVSILLSFSNYLVLIILLFLIIMFSASSS